MRLVNTTDQAFKFVASSGHFAEIVRTRLAPILLPKIVRFEAVREYIFRTLSQITLNYRGKGLDEGHAGPVHGGDRLPWVRLDNGDNYDALRHIGWQIHVYGAAKVELNAWCKRRDIRLQIYPWQPTFHEVGLREDSLYLIRPDTYVALAEDAQNVAAVERFLDRIRVHP